MAAGAVTATVVTAVTLAGLSLGSPALAAGKPAGRATATTTPTTPVPTPTPSPTPPPVPGPATVPVGASLLAGSRLSTTTGYSLVMQRDGNLVERGLGRLLWTSRTHIPGSYAVLQPDGNLIVYSPTRVAQWMSHTHGRRSAVLTLGVGGDLALTNIHGGLLWDNQVAPNRLAPTGSLTSGQTIYSVDGGTRLTMGRTGNLVLQTIVGRAWRSIWSSGSQGHPGSYLRMRINGDLVVTDAAGTVVWSTSTLTPGPVHLSVEGGGNARIYDPASDLIASLGDDYPAYLRAARQDSLVDPWGYYNRECVSFAAYRALSRDRVDVYYAGSAYQWARYARKHHYIVSAVPAPGSVAWTNAGKFGHVAMVEKVLGPWLVVEEYNYLTPGVYSHRVVLASRFKAFLHFELPPTTPVPAAPTAADPSGGAQNTADGGGPPRVAEPGR